MTTRMSTSHIAVGVRCTVGVRAEQDNFLGLKTLGHLAGELPDHPHGHVRPAISAWQVGVCRLGRFLGHAVILPVLPWIRESLCSRAGLGSASTARGAAD